MNPHKLALALGISSLILFSSSLEAVDMMEKQDTPRISALVQAQDLLKTSMVMSPEAKKLIEQGQLVSDSELASPARKYAELNLKQAVEIALQNNLAFQSAFTNLEIADRSQNAARAQLLEPALGLEAGRNRADQPGRTNAREDTVSATYRQTFENSVEFQASAERNISRNGANSASSNVYRAQVSRTVTGKSDSFLDRELSIDLATNEQQVSYHNYMDAYQKLVFDVVSAFLKAIKDYQQIEVSESVLKYRKELLELTRVKYNLGVSTRLDVLRVEVQVAQQEEKIIAARNLYENSRDSLLNLMNYELSPDVSLTYAHADSERSYDTEWYLGQAREKRHDLIVARLGLEQQKLRENVVFAKKDPKVNANLNYQDGRFFSASIGFAAPPANDYSQWAATLSYDLPLGNIAKKEALNIARLRTNNEIRRVEEVQDDVELAVKNSIRDLIATHKRIKVLQKNVEQAEENLKLSQLSYEKGIKALIDVLDSQDDLLEVKTSYVNSILDLKVAEMALLRSCGLISAPDAVIQEAMRRAGISQVVSVPTGETIPKSDETGDNPWNRRQRRR